MSADKLLRELAALGAIITIRKQGAFWWVGGHWPGAIGPQFCCPNLEQGLGRVSDYLRTHQVAS